MKAGRPRVLADLRCVFCAKVFRPKRAVQRFCSRGCKDLGHRLVPASAPTLRRSRPRYTYDGRLSDALWREIFAARAEAGDAPLYRPGAAI